MDIIGFFKKTTHLTPTTDQELFLEALIDPNIPQMIGSCARQTGKSLCSADATLYWIYEDPIIMDVLLASAMDSYIYDHVDRILNKNPDLYAQVVNEGITGLVPLRGFQIKRGSRVHVRGATPKQCRGLPVQRAIVDEAELVPNDTIITIQGNLSGEFTKFVLLGTYPIEERAQNGLYARILRDPKKYGFKHFTWSEENCPWHTKESLASKKRTMTPLQYKAEVLGEVPTTEDRNLFSSNHLDSCIFASIEKENAPSSRVEAGIDWGYDPASTVLCVTERIFNRRRMLDIKGWEKKPIEEIAPEIAKILEDYKVVLVKADARPAEYKHKLEKHTKIPIYYIEGNMHKYAMLSQLQRKIRQHSLEIAQGELTLITQLRKYRRGRLRDDDYVDALALSCYEPAEPLESRPTPTVII